MRPGFWRGSVQERHPLEDMNLEWTVTLKSFLKDERVAQTGFT